MNHADAVDIRFPSPDEEFKRELIVAAIRGLTTRAVVVTDSAAQDIGAAAIQIANAVIRELKKEANVSRPAE